MAASFPSSVKAFTTKIDGVNDVMAVDINGLQDEVIAVENHLITGRNGWTLYVGTWSPTSGTTITVPTGAAAIFAVGDKWKIPGFQGYIVGVADTVLTVVGDLITDFSPSSNCYYSHAANPQGFPQWFAWAALTVGFSVLPSGLVHRFCVHGRTCTIVHYGNPVGTSNATTYTVGLPIISAAAAAPVYTKTGFAYNAGVPTDGVVVVSAGSAIATLYPTGVLGAWTASGGKAAAFRTSYEI